MSIHVRRGDYLKISGTSGICDDKYYAAIMKMFEMHDSEIIVFFSDYIEWYREYFQSIMGKLTVYFVDWNKGIESYRGMQLISLCSHNIIANSSFLWRGHGLIEG